MEAFYRNVLDQLHEALYVVDNHRKISFWNRSAERITGRDASTVVGQRCPDGVLEHVDEHGRRLCGSHCPLLMTMRTRTAQEGHVFLRHSDGHRVPVVVRASPLYDDDGRVVGAVETFSDDSSLAEARARIDQLADENMRDALTGLGNRRLADRKLDAGLAQVHERGARHGVLFIDVDHFKQVNDLYGHNVGDQVLVTVARTLEATLRRSDFPTRWGGEEFVVVALDVDEDYLAGLAQRTRALVARSCVQVEGGALAVTVSVGATLMRPDDDRDSLLARVDALMYRSKERGRNRVSLG